MSSSVFLNSLLAFFHYYGVPENDEHLPRRDGTAHAVGDDLCRFLDGLALAGVSSCESGAGKWRVIATALLRTNKGLELYVAENTVSTNRLYNVPKHFEAIWTILRDLSLTNFDPTSLSPPAQVPELLTKLLVRYLAFSLPRLRFRFMKYADKFLAVVSSHVETLAGAADAVARARFTDIRDCFTRLKTLLSSLQLGDRFSSDDDEFDMTKLLPKDRAALLELWHELKRLRELTNFGATMGPDQLFNDCESLFISLIKKNSTTTAPMARYVKKILSYVAVYNDLVLFAQSNEMRTYRTLPMVVRSMTVGCPLSSTFEFDLHNAAMTEMLDKQFGPVQSAALRSHSAFVDRLKEIVDRLWNRDKSRRIKFAEHQYGILSPTLVHCECALARELDDRCVEDGSNIAVRHIGVSKLSCLPCKVYIAVLGRFQTRGSHGAVDIPWSTPSGKPPARDAALLVSVTTAFRGILSSYGTTTPTKVERRDSGSTTVSYRRAACVDLV